MKCKYYVNVNIGIKKRIRKSCGGRPFSWKGQPILGPYDTKKKASSGLKRYRKQLEK